MDAPIITPNPARNQTSTIQYFSPVILLYLRTISSGQRPLPSSQLEELSKPPHNNEFLKYMSSSASNALSELDPIDLSHPLSSYYVNSSHNTYLTGNQLYSVSSTAAYKHVLLRGCRCIEIDVWDGESRSSSVAKDEEKKHGLGRHIRDKISDRLSHDSSAMQHISDAPDDRASLSLPEPWTSASSEIRIEPRVLHGYTLTKEVRFRDVCDTIRDTAFVHSDLPVVVSLEIHASHEQQEIMVEIMSSSWKGLLVKPPHTQALHLPSPESLRRKILVKVKYVNPATAVQPSRPDGRSRSNSPRPNLDNVSSSEDEILDAPEDVKKKKKKKKFSVIPSLSALGIYTQAIHFSSLTSPDATLPMHVFSLSEKKLMEVHSTSGPTLFSHNRNYLMRAFPSGTRVRSDNLDPAVFWRKGVQFVALNWQSWDQGMMLNESMFNGSDGYVLKPEGYRSTFPQTSTPAITTQTQAEAVEYRTLDLSIDFLAAQSIPLPIGDTKAEKFHPYIKCELHVEEPAERTGEPIEGGGRSKDGRFKWKSTTMRGTEVDFGGERAEFKSIMGVVEQLTFLRLKIQDDEIGKDDLAAWACIRLDRLRSGYRFVHLLDAAGMESQGILLVGIEKSLS